LKYASNRDLNDNNTTSKLLKVIKVFQAEASNDERIKKSINGLRDRVAKGYYPFPVKQGYKKSEVSGLHVPDGERFNLIKNSFREILAGTSVYEALSNLLESGYKSPSGKLIRIDHLRKILVDPFYAGMIRVSTWSEKYWNNKGLHERMITPDEHEIVKAIVNDKKRKFIRKKRNPKFPMSNFIYCGMCGEGKFVGCKHSNGKGWSKDEYRCRVCNKTYSRDIVHKGIDNFLEKINFSLDHKETIVDSLRQIWKEAQSANILKAKQLGIRLDALEQSKGKLLSSMAENPELSEDYKCIIEDKKNEIESVKNEISAVEHVDKDFVEFVGFSISFIDKLKKNWWDLDYSDRLKCKQLVFKSEIYIDLSGKVYTHEISPILKLFDKEKETQNVSKSSLVEQEDVFWNTFIDYALEWGNTLKTVYK